jgi:hypothetical protein
MRGFIVAALAAVFLGGCVAPFTITDQSAAESIHRERTIRSENNHIKGGTMYGLFINPYYIFNQISKDTIYLFVDDKFTHKSYIFFDPMETLILTIDGEPLSLRIGGSGKYFGRDSSEWGSATIKFADYERLLTAKKIEIKIVGRKLQQSYGSVSSSFIKNLQLFYDAIKDKIAKTTAVKIADNKTQTAGAVTGYSPKWVQLVEGSDLAYYDDGGELLTLHLSNGASINNSDWTEHLKPYIESFPLPKRDIVLKGVTRYTIKYDKVDRVIKFFSSGYVNRSYNQSSYIALDGTLTKNKATASIGVRYHGSSWIFADSLKIVVDDKTYELKNSFSRRHASTVWETAYLSLDDQYNRKIIDEIVKSKETIIRFRGRGQADLEVTDRMKEDMGLMLRAIDAINAR